MSQTMPGSSIPSRAWNPHPPSDSLEMQVDAIVTRVAAACRVEKAALYGYARGHGDARLMVAWLTFRLVDCSPAQIGKAFGRRHRTTIDGLQRSADLRRARDAVFRRRVDAILDAAGGGL